MHVLAAPDKFKGSLTAREVAERIAAGIEAETPHVPVVQAPVADGGDGTVDAALAAGFEGVQVRAQGPTGEPVDTAFAVREGVAVVEMADVSGLRRLPQGRLAPALMEVPGWSRRWGDGCSTRPVTNFPPAGERWPGWPGLT